MSATSTCYLMKKYLLFIFILVLQYQLNAQNRYWVANSLANWSSNNWSNSPTGNPDGLGAPTATQRAVFNNNHLGTCRLDQLVTIESISIDASFVGTIDFNSFSMNIVGSNDNYFYNGSLIDASNNSQLNINSSGRLFCSNVEISIPMDVICGNLYLNGSTYNKACTFNKTGPGNDFGNGGNIFNDYLTLINSGSGYLVLGGNQADIYNQDISVSNSGTNLIHLAYNSTGNLFNGNIILSSTNGQGIRFGQGTALNDASLAANKTIFIGADGFSAGNLEIQNFLQSSQQPLAVSLSGTAYLYLENGTVFNGRLNLEAPQIFCSGVQFNAPVSLNKTGAGNNYSSGNNTFNDTTELINSGTGLFAFGNVNADIFNAPLTLINQGNNHLFLAYNSLGNQINDKLTIINQANSTNNNIYLAYGSNSQLNIVGKTTVINQGNAANNSLYLGLFGSIVFNDDLSLDNSGTGNNSAIYLNDRTNSINNYLGNISISSTTGQGIRFGQNGGIGRLAVAKNINIGAAGFTAGMLRLQNFTQLGTTNHSFNMSANSYFYGSNNHWNGDFSVTAPRLYSASSYYGAQLYLEKTGATNDYSAGGNTVLGSATLIHAGSNNLLFGNTLADTFMQNVSIVNRGTGTVYIGNNNNGHFIGGHLDIIQSSTGTSNSIQLANSSNCFIRVVGNTTVQNNGSGTNNHIYLGNNGSILFEGSLRLSNIGSSTNGAIYLNHGATSNNNYADSIILTSTNGGGIRFGQNGGSGTLAINQKISVGAAGYNSGNLTFRNFSQLGTNLHHLLLSGTAYLYMRSSSWEADIDFTAPRVYSWDCTFGGNLKLTKTGASNDYCPGGNSISGNTELTNSGTAFWVMGNGNADIFRGNLVINNTGTSSTYVANNGSGHRIDGNLTINQLGTANSNVMLASSSNANLTVAGITEAINNGSATNNIYLSNSGSILFNDKVILKNIGAGTNSRIYLNSRTGSLNTYNEDIELHASNGQGIRFGESGGAAVLAANKTISVGLGGFSSGTLFLRNFSQTGATAQQLTLTGSAYLYLRDADWGGSVTFTAPRVYTNGSSYRGTCLLHKTGSGGDTSPGGNQFRQNTEIRNSGSGSFIMGNGNADIFEANLDLYNTGSSNLYLANSGLGHVVQGNLNVFQTASGINSSLYISNRNGTQLDCQGLTQIINNGSGSNNRIYLGNGGSIIFDRSLDLLNIGTGNNSGIYLNQSINSFNRYNDNIQLTSTGGQGIRFGDNGGSAILAANKTLNISPTGFTTGRLVFRNFTQLGNTAQNLLLSGSGYLYLRNAYWGGDIYFSSPRFYTADSRFLGLSYIEKTGPDNDYSPGGNYFLSDASIIHSGDNAMIMGNGQADTFQTNLEVINNGTGSFYLANQGPNHFIGGNLDLSHLVNADNDILVLANNTLSSLRIDGNTNLINNTSSNSNRVYLGNYGDIIFNGQLRLHNLGSGINSGIYLNNRTTSNNSFNENIQLECISGTGIRFGDAGGQASLAAGKTISIFNNFSAGQLLFRNFTQTGNQAQQIQLSNTATFYNYDADWGGNVQFEGPRLYTRGTQYRGTARLIKSSISNDYSNGNNVFNESCELINTGNGLFAMGNNNPDIFEKEAVFRNQGQYRMYIAHNSSGNQFKDKVFFYNSASDASNNDCQLNCGTNSTAVFSDSVFLINQSTGYNSFNICNYGQADFLGPLSILNHGTHNSNFVHLNRANSGSNFYADIIVESSTGNGIYFGQGGGSSTLATNRRILIGPLGYSQGNLYLRNFTQLGTTAQSLSLSGTSILSHYNNNWNAAVQFTAPRQLLRSTLFNASAYLEKSGGSNDYSYGGCIFNSSTTIVNSSNNQMVLDNNSPNDFNAAVSFNQRSNGRLYPNYNQACTFASDINIDFPVGQSVLFGVNNNAAVILDGTQPQSINDLANSENPIFRNLYVNQSAGGSVQLNTVSAISNELQLNQGIIFNSTNTLLRILDNAFISSVSDISYVNGPVEKIGNDAFTFPVGKNNRYRPCGISAPNSTVAAFRAEYFQNNPDPLYNTNLKDLSIDFVSNCEYWMMDRTAAASSVRVTLSWNDFTSCGLKQLALTQVVRWDGNLWRDHGNANPTTSTVSSATAINNFSPFTLSVIDPGLPVDWLQFDVVRGLEDSVLIDWATASETNNLGFELQRMLDTESSFSSIAWVDGQGSSTNINYYRHIDANAHQGISYYRLKQLDIDGTFSFSETKALAGLSSDIVFDATIFPNPVQDIITIKTNNLSIDSETLRIRIMAVDGREIWSTWVPSKKFHSYQFDYVQNLASGVYLIQLSNERGDSKSFRFTKTN